MVITWLMMVNNNLAGGIPTPLRNDGVRQLGWWHSQIWKNKTCSKPPARWNMGIDHQQTFGENLWFHPGKSWKKPFKHGGSRMKHRRWHNLTVSNCHSTINDQDFTNKKSWTELFFTLKTGALVAIHHALSIIYHLYQLISIELFQYIHVSYDHQLSLISTYPLVN